jgi:hypothetical protein
LPQVCNGANLSTYLKESPDVLNFSFPSFIHIPGPRAEL